LGIATLVVDIQGPTSHTVKEKVALAPFSIVALEWKMRHFFPTCEVKTLAGQFLGQTQVVPESS
jgi:hypothetical protein